MYEEAQATPPLLDYAAYSVPVEVRESLGRGRGLFTTLAVTAGDLLLCEKAFAYAFSSDDEPNSRTLMNMTTKKLTLGGQAILLTDVAQKVYHRSSFSTDFQSTQWRLPKTGDSRSRWCAGCRHVSVDTERKAWYLSNRSQFSD